MLEELKKFRDECVKGAVRALFKELGTVLAYLLQRPEGSLCGGGEGNKVVVIDTEK